MFCTNCGAVVVGKFCSCCGKKVRRGIEDFRRFERAEVKKFTHSYYKPGGSLGGIHLADACYLACEMKFKEVLPYVVWNEYGELEVSPNAYENLKKVLEHAKKLCDWLYAANDF